MSEYLIETDVLRTVLRNGSGSDEVNDLIREEIKRREADEENRQREMLASYRGGPCPLCGSEDKCDDAIVHRSTCQLNYHRHGREERNDHSRD